jgi:hypothetical protein
MAAPVAPNPFLAEWIAKACRFAGCTEAAHRRRADPWHDPAGAVLVGTRSVLADFLSAVTRGFAQSLREP